MENKTLELELYKELKKEYRQYISTVSDLWKWKLLAVGAILSYAILGDLESVIEASIEASKQKNEDIGKNFIIISALWMIPIVCFLIDFIILGIGFHLKNISNFIEIKLKDINVAGEWEAFSWRTGKHAKLRTIVTFIGTSGVSVAIYIYVLMVYCRFMQEGCNQCYWIGIVLPLFIIFTVFIISKVIYKD